MTGSTIITPKAMPYGSLLHLGFDASQAPQAPPVKGATCVLIYTGRVGFTPHVWTVEQADRFANLRQFPMWLPDFSNTPNTEGIAACRAATGMGWAAHMPEPYTRALGFDFETRIDPEYYDGLATTAAAAGFSPFIYGSLSTVLGNAAADNMIAAWDGIPDLKPGQTIHGEQFANDGTFDLFVFDQYLYNRGGVGPRRHVA